jgi:flagellin
MSIDSIDLSTAAGAETAMSSIDTAINSVNTALGNIGAFQNRMDFASANLASVFENVSSAESTIRDADIAKETTDFTRNQILVQAGVAVLAQANIVSQSALALLQ